MNVSIVLVMLVILLSLHQMSIISTYILYSIIVVLRSYWVTNSRTGRSCHPNAKLSWQFSSANEEVDTVSNHHVC
jgi:hypothetical protein